IAVSPSMIEASKIARGASFLPAHDGSPMGAAVKQHKNFSTRVSRQYNGLASEGHGLVVPRVCHLALMADKDPRVVEDPLHLQLKYVRVDVDQSMNPVVRNQIANRIAW